MFLVRNRHRTRQLIAAFAGDQGGQIAMIFTVCLIPIVLIVGAALDYSRAAQAHTALVNITDTGALVGARDRSSGVTDSNVIATRVNSVISTQYKQDVGGTTVLSVNVTMDTDSVDVKSTANVPTTFMKMIGISTIPIEATSSAAFGAMQYVDFHFLLDTSDSMGLAADSASRTALRSATATFSSRTSCEFACHTVEDASEGMSRLARARSLNLKLRIDVAKDGIKSFINLAKNDSANSTSRFSLSTFSTNLTNLVPLTATHTTVTTALNGIDLGYDIPNDHASSYFDRTSSNYVTMINNFPQQTPTRTQAPYVIIVSDGVQSGWGARYSNGTIRVFDQSVCQTFKNAGFQVAVVYTKYYPIPSDPFYRDNVAPLYNNIEPNLRSCASSADLFAVGDTPGEIDAAFSKIFNSIRSKVRLSS